MRLADLDEKVIATFYDEEREEWICRTTTIEDVLASVCDNYTILPSAQPTYTDEEIQRMQDLTWHRFRGLMRLDMRKARKSGRQGNGLQ